MKSASLRFSVDATSPPTLTCAPWPNSTPLALIRNTLPFAVRLPMITDGSPPITRLSATEFASGWTKSTRCPRAMLKLSQLIAAALVDCATVTEPAPLVIVALPATTLPPTGKSCACAADAQASEPIRPERTSRASAVVPNKTCRLRPALEIGAGEATAFILTVLALACPVRREVRPRRQNSLTIWNQKRPGRSGSDKAGASLSLCA